MPVTTSCAVSYKQATQIMLALYQARLNSNCKMSPMLVGPPGTGKTACALDAAEAIKASLKERGLTDFQVKTIHLPTIEAPDVGGLPYPSKDGKEFSWLPPSTVREICSTQHGVLIFDDAAQAPIPVLNAARSISYDGVFAGIKIPKGWMVIITANRETDNSGSSPIPRQFMNTVMRLDMDGDTKDWIDHAKSRRMDPKVVSFIKANTGALNSFNPENPVNPTSRTWTGVADLLQHLPNDRHILTAAIGGLVGHGAAVDFVKHLTTKGKIMTPREILKNPHTAEIDPDTTHALTNLVELAAIIKSTDELEAACVYLARHDHKEAPAIFKNTFLSHDPTLTDKIERGPEFKRIFG